MLPLSRLCAALCLASTVAVGQTFMPPNDMHLDPVLAPTMTKAEFDATISKFEAVYAPLFKEAFGATLVIHRKWQDNTVNAYAYQSGKTWNVAMFGGLARRISSTDGLAIVLAHELSHHVGGYPFVPGNGTSGGGDSWAANDGQSDYAAISAFRRVFAEEKDVNERYAKIIPQYPKKMCDQAWEGIDDRNLCYRGMMAGMSTAELLAGGRSAVKFETPDRRETVVTNNRHPMAQCRLDTFSMANACVRSYDDVIPGKSLPNRNSPEAERESANYSCHAMNGDKIGMRPRCWFAPLVK
jgi:hypothetical protein